MPHVDLSATTSSLLIWRYVLRPSAICNELSDIWSTTDLSDSGCVRAVTPLRLMTSSSWTTTLLGSYGTVATPPRRASYINDATLAFHVETRKRVAVMDVIDLSSDSGEDAVLSLPPKKRPRPSSSCSDCSDVVVL